jgi:hypothetical protein
MSLGMRTIRHRHTYVVGSYEKQIGDDAQCSYCCTTYKHYVAGILHRTPSLCVLIILLYNLPLVV